MQSGKDPQCMIFILEHFMETLKASFEDVANWCEKHLEDERGRAIGMTFGAMLRAHGRLATLSTGPHGEQRAAKEQQLNAKAEELLLKLSTKCFLALEIESKGRRPVDPKSMRTNMIHDPGPR